MWYGRSSPSGSWTLSSAPNGPKRSSSSGISAGRYPRQTNGPGPLWCGPCKGSSPSCRLRSVCSSANGTIGRNTRSIFCAPIDLALSAQHILPIYQKRWPIEVDNFYVKQHLGLADFRVQSYEATEKWFAVVFLALAFLQWRVHHAPAEERLRSVADVVSQHRSEHARTLLETACQEAAKLIDYLPVFKRFLCQPT